MFIFEKTPVLKPLRLFSIALLFAGCLSSSFAGDDKYARYQHIVLIKNDSVKCAELIRYGESVVDSLHDYNFALLILEKAATVLKEKNYPLLRLRVEHQLGKAYYRKGDFEEADQHLIKALSSPALAKDLVLRSRILNTAGANLQDLGAFKRALVYYNEALEIDTKLNDLKSKGIVYQNMANIFALSGDLAQSDLFFDKALKLFKENNFMENYGVVMGNKAYILWKLGKIDSAKTLMIRSLKMDTSFTTFNSVIERYFNLGLVYSELKRWDSCFFALERGKFLVDSLHFLDHYDGQYYYTLGYCYNQKGESAKAIFYYKKALSIKDGIANYKFLYDNIASVFYKNKQYDSAFLYKNEGMKITDSIYKSELKEHIIFENKRIELLEKDYQNQIQSARQQQSLQSLEKGNYLLIGLVVILIVLMLFLFLYFRQYKLRIKKEHLQSEIDFLRGQLNPHFLFNSINNIYVLLDENKEKASAILLKFSELMRYQLYECNVSLIHLSKELQFLENYMEFEKLRYSNKISVSYQQDHAASGNLMIAPLLLQPFIENAFKHTPKNKLHKSEIFVRVQVKDKEVLLEVMNTRDPRESSALPGGIGLDNVRKRLKLLYPGRYDLQIITPGNQYHVILKLILTDD